MRAFFIILAFIASAAHAEMVKLAVPNGQGMQMFWWPKLEVPSGWHQEMEASFRTSSNVMVQDGSNFSNSPTVIYARAIYKPRVRSIGSLAQLIENDHRDFRENVSRIAIEKTEHAITADGHALQSYLFTPEDEGNWERVSYGEEPDYFLIFTVSSRSEEGLNEAMETYDEVVGSYSESPNK